MSVGALDSSETGSGCLGPVTPRHLSEIRLDRIVLILIAVIALGRLIYVATASMADLTFRTSDDSYYYFNVARNVAAGHGFTFDGINHTNGFHPLWMLFLLPIYAVFGSDPDLSLRVVSAMMALLAAGTCWLAYRSLGAATGRFGALVTLALMGTPFVVNPLLNGLETGLVLFLLFACLRLAQRANQPIETMRYWQFVLLGLVLASVFLCRLDCVFWVGSVLGLIGLRGLRCWSTGPDRSAAVVAKICLAGVVLCMVVGPYLAWNYLTTGHMVPISGGLKSSFPHVSLTVKQACKTVSLFGIGQYAFCSAVLLWIYVSRRGDQAAKAQAEGIAARQVSIDFFLSLWVGATVHLANTLLFMDWGVEWWHYVSYVPMTLMASAWVFSASCVRLSLSSAMKIALLTLVVLASLSSLVAETLLRAEHHRPWLEAARWAGDHLPRNAVVGMTDCGLFGYFCGRPTINLDGVINGYEYQTALRDGRLEEYFRRCGVTHIADYETTYANGMYKIVLPSRLYRSSGWLLLAQPNTEVYASLPYKHARSKGTTHFAIWDIGSLAIVSSELQGQTSPSDSRMPIKD